MFEGKRISTIEGVDSGLLNVDEYNADNHETYNLYHCVLF